VVRAVAQLHAPAQRHTALQAQLSPQVQREAVAAAQPHAAWLQ
jgi:hypothetical protein